MLTVRDPAEMSAEYRLPLSETARLVVAQGEPALALFATVQPPPPRPAPPLPGPTGGAEHTAAAAAPSDKRGAGHGRGPVDLARWCCVSMPRVKFAFTKDQLDAAPARTATRAPTPTPTRGGVVNGVFALNPTSEIPEADRFTPMGNFGLVPVRTGVVRLAFMKLLITLLLAALCAGFSPNKHVAFSCSLAAAVNLIAVVHYAFIWAIRAQVLPDAYKRFAAKPRGAYTRLGEGAEDPEPWEADDKRNLLMQEFAVDALRHSDWAVTLVFMTLDMWDLAEYANPPFDAAVDGNVTACVAAHGADGCASANPVYKELNRHICAALQPLIVLCGTVPRFYLGELRQPTDPKKMSRSGYLRLVALGLVFWGGGFAIWYTCSRALYDRLWKDGPIEERYWAGAFRPTRGASTTSSGLASWSGSSLATPLSRPSSLRVQVAARGWFKMTKVGADSYPAGLSFTKDLLYGVLDVLTKGGLAMYASSRAAYL